MLLMHVPGLGCFFASKPAWRLLQEKQCDAMSIRAFR